MKKLITLFIGILSFANGETTSPFRDKNSSLKIGGSYSYLWMKPEGFSTFKGSLGGVQGIYEYTPNDSVYAAAKLSWRQGATSESNEHRFILDIDTQERIGYTVFPDCFPMKLSFFTGLGFRLFNHFLTQPVLSSIQFKYQEFYVPFGILTTFRLNKWLQVGIHAIWMPQIFPTVVIRPIGQTNWSIQKTVRNGSIEIPFNVQLPCWGLFSLEFKPFFQSWESGKTLASREGVPLGIPKNRSLFSGAELNLKWLF